MGSLGATRLAQAAFQSNAFQRNAFQIRTYIISRTAPDQFVDFENAADFSNENVGRLILVRSWCPGERTKMSKETHARHRDKLGAIAREPHAMSDWELERGCASSLGFDDDRRWIANRILGSDMPDQSEGSASRYWR